jgi:diguanylate cyclase (GGDEF)-like protein/hemerythrin-like metal-binding protein
MNADVPTMFLVIILVGAVLSLSVGVVADRSQRDGMPYWATGLLMHTSAYVLFSLRGQINDFASIVIANALLSCALATFTEGLYAFYRGKAPRRLIWAPVAVIVVSFSVLLDHLSLRIAVGALIFMLQCLAILAFMWGKRRETTGRGKYFLACGIAIMSAMLLVRAAAAAIGATAAMLSLTDANLIQTLTFLGALMALLLLAIGFVLMSKERSDQLNQILATSDELTGLANRRRLDETLSSESARAGRSGQPLGLAMIDIDQFKDYNDHYGHQAGDECLKRVAKTIASAAKRAGDLAARYGGEEFVLILPDADAAAARGVAEDLRQSIEALAMHHVRSPSGRVTVSIGVAALGNDGAEDPESLLRAADAALYRAKHGGRNQVQAAPASSQPSAVGKRTPTKLVQLVWRTAFESGNPVIDAQHRGLFRGVNKLLGAVLEEHQIDEVAALVEAFVADIGQHFRDEEAIITEAGYPDAASHASLHRALIEQAGTLANHFRDGTLSLGELFEYLAHDVVARHMLIADHEFFPYLQAQR